jgi:hypothetical protein
LELLISSSCLERLSFEKSSRERESDDESSRERLSEEASSRERLSEEASSRERRSEGASSRERRSDDVSSRERLSSDVSSELRLRGRGADSSSESDLGVLRLRGVRLTAASGIGAGGGSALSFLLSEALRVRRFGAALVSSASFFEIVSSVIGLFTPEPFGS